MDDREIAALLRQYRRRGNEEAAELREGSSGYSPASTDPAAAAPAAAAVPVVADPAPPVAVPPEVAALAAQRAAGPNAPPGKAPLTIADLSTISQSEAVARMDEVEWLEREEAR
jgi:hypothetical protein